MGLYTGGLIFGMVRVLVNWWAYTWGGLYSGGLIFGGLRYTTIHDLSKVTVVDLKTKG